ncbi:MAG: hypothetical protein ABFD82_05855 [Syntrophaceae bacterium]
MEQQEQNKKNATMNVVEITPAHLLTLMLKYKWMIISFTIIAALIPVVFNIKELSLPSRQHPAIGITQIYARCVLAAKDETINSITNAFQTDKLKNNMMANKNVLRALGNYYWDDYNTDWLKKKVLSQDDIKVLLGKIDISKENDTPSIVILFHHRDPKIAQEVLGYYLYELDKYFNDRAKADKQERIEAYTRCIKDLTGEFTKANNIHIKQSIALYIGESVAERSSLATSKYKAFEVLESPYVPPLYSELNPKVKKIKGWKIIALFATFAFVFSIVIAFLVEFTRRWLRDRSEIKN